MHILVRTTDEVWYTYKTVPMYQNTFESESPLNSQEKFLTGF